MDGGAYAESGGPFGAPQSGAYGAPGASGVLPNPSEFVKKPHVILRLISWVFSIIVFGCISSSAWDGNTCYYGAGEFGDPAACGYGTAVGVLAFLFVIVFIVSDVMFESVSNAVHRKYIVIADIACSGLMSFLWFVCFCYLTDAWRHSVPPEHGYWRGSSGMEAAIAFAFFSIASFVSLTVLAVMRYREGVPSGLSNDYNADPFGGFESSLPASH